MSTQLLGIALDFSSRELSPTVTSWFSASTAFDAFESSLIGPSFSSLESLLA
jgi:hypothetical protein